MGTNGGVEVNNFYWWEKEGGTLKKGKVFNSWLAKLFVVPVLVMLNGCVYIAVGSLGALGGYVISPDTVEGITKNDKDDIWAAAQEIVKIMGYVEDEFEDAGILVAQINNAEVTITIASINDETSRLSIKARKTFFPKIRLAQDIYVKIISRVNE